MSVDGAPTTTATQQVDGTPQHRRIVAHWAGSPGMHVLELVHAGTAEHSSMNVDGFTVLR